MTEDWRKELVQKIQTAFSDTPRPREQGFVISGWRFVTEGIEGRHWSELEFDILFKHRNALHFFQDDQLQFYLPAFLKAAVLYPEEMDTLTDNLFSLLVGGERKVKKLSDHFRHQEKVAIAAFLEAFLKIFPDDIYGWSDKQKKKLKKAVQYWKEVSATFTMQDLGQDEQ
jgi:hypothetical protein